MKSTKGTRLEVTGKASEVQETIKEIVPLIRAGTSARASAGTVGAPAASAGTDKATMSPDPNVISVAIALAAVLVAAVTVLLSDRIQGLFLDVWYHVVALVVMIVATGAAPFALVKGFVIRASNPPRRTAFRILLVVLVGLALGSPIFAVLTPGAKHVSNGDHSATSKFASALLNALDFPSGWTKADPTGQFKDAIKVGNLSLCHGQISAPVRTAVVESAFAPPPPPPQPGIGPVVNQIAAFAPGGSKTYLDAVAFDARSCGNRIPAVVVRTSQARIGGGCSLEPGKLYAQSLLLTVADTDQGYRADLDFVRVGDYLSEVFTLSFPGQAQPDLVFLDTLACVSTQHLNEISIGR